MRTVLIAEDSAVHAETLEIALSKMPDTEVVHVGNGRLALQYLEEHASDIAALVTDLRLPLIDGFDLIARVRRHPRLVRLPIIVVSGEAAEDTADRVAKLGANAFFSKPASPGQVRRKLEQLLNEQKQ